MDAHVIRAAAVQAFSSQPHIHKTEFQLVYILRGWIEFEHEGQGVVRLEAGYGVHRRRAYAIASWGIARTSRCSRSCCRPAA
ncbi:hypothetical protein [Paucibacter soli]|uniref:hypothetical protein n=1 Tax=Paucibacter soli TaxID=3133433 RepID=UPI00309626A8